MKHRRVHSPRTHTSLSLSLLTVIGWTDTPLTDDGVLEARVGGEMLYKSGMLFDEVHTSLLRRSIRTANLCLMELGQEYIPVYKHWRLNERSYGDLVGKNKKQVVRRRIASIA